MRETSRASIKHNVFDKKLPPNQLYEDLTLEGISEVYVKGKKHSKEEEFSLIIMDDVQDSLISKNVVKILNKLIANQRHTA
jgi:uncharacterized protein YejL (UPF0352 family)